MNEQMYVNYIMDSPAKFVNATVTILALLEALAGRNASENCLNEFTSHIKNGGAVDISSIPKERLNDFVFFCDNENLAYQIIEDKDNLERVTIITCGASEPQFDSRGQVIRDKNGFSVAKDGDKCKILQDFILNVNKEYNHSIKVRHENERINDVSNLRNYTPTFTNLNTDFAKIFRHELITNGVDTCLLKTGSDRTHVCVDKKGFKIQDLEELSTVEKAFLSSLKLYTNKDYQAFLSKNKANLQKVYDDIQSLEALTKDGKEIKDFKPYTIYEPVRTNRDGKSYIGAVDSYIGSDKENRMLQITIDYPVAHVAFRDIFYEKEHFVDLDLTKKEDKLKLFQYLNEMYATEICNDPILFYGKTGNENGHYDLSVANLKTYFSLSPCLEKDKLGKELFLNYNPEKEITFDTLNISNLNLSSIDKEDQIKLITEIEKFKNASIEFEKIKNMQLDISKDIELHKDEYLSERNNNLKVTILNEQGILMLEQLNREMFPLIKQYSEDLKIDINTAFEKDTFKAINIPEALKTKNLNERIAEILNNPEYIKSQTKASFLSNEELIAKYKYEQTIKNMTKLSRTVGSVNAEIFKYNNLSKDEAEKLTKSNTTINDLCKAQYEKLNEFCTDKKSLDRLLDNIEYNRVKTPRKETLFNEDLNVQEDFNGIMKSIRIEDTSIILSDTYVQKVKDNVELSAINQNLTGREKEEYTKVQLSKILCAELKTNLEYKKDESVQSGQILFDIDGQVARAYGQDFCASVINSDNYTDYYNRQEEYIKEKARESIENETSYTYSVQSEFDKNSDFIKNYRNRIENEKQIDKMYNDMAKDEFNEDIETQVYFDNQEIYDLFKDEEEEYDEDEEFDDDEEHERLK